MALARRAISSGSIDGVNGSQTRAALLAFQRENKLSLTGELDAATRNVLTLDDPPLTSYVITSNDLARLQPISKTWLGKSQQSALDYETLLELVAEKGHASPTLTKRLNPGVNWTNVVAGDEVKIPAVEYPARKLKQRSLSSVWPSGDYRRLTRTLICSRTSRAASRRSLRSVPWANCTSKPSRRIPITPSTRKCFLNPKKRSS